MKPLYNSMTFVFVSSVIINTYYYNCEAAYDLSISLHPTLSWTNARPENQRTTDYIKESGQYPTINCRKYAH